MPGFDVVILATFGLPPRRLPATDLPQAFRLLAVALIPAPWPVLATDTLCAGRFAGAVGALWPNDRAFPYAGRCPREVLCSQGKARGECVNILLGRYQNSNETLTGQSTRFSRTRQRTKRPLDEQLEGDTRVARQANGRSQMIKTGSDSVLGPIHAHCRSRR